MLTTSGEYKYALKCNSNTVHDETSPAVKTLTDAKIKKLDDDDLVSNWGWFGINIWETDKFVDSCNDVYSGYNEAMDAFKAFIQRTVIAS